MQLVIEISEDTFFDLKKKQNRTEVDNAVLNGTLLPKEHGKLIDADEVVKEICIEYKVNSIYELPNELRSFIKKYLNEVPTILKPTVEYMIKNYTFSKSEG